MSFVDLIETKKAGRVLTSDEIRGTIDAYVAGKVPDYQMAALLMAVRWRGLSVDETTALTLAMLGSGERYDLSDLCDRPVDKHSTGGVGDKLSLIVAPLAASCGCVVPMISGRGLGHTGGTLDKLESIPGFRTDLDARAFRAQLGTLGVALGAQTASLVPADRHLYALRDVTGTVDDPGLIAASILSKKLAEGARGLVLDVKVGAGAFACDRAAAGILAERLLTVGRRCGLEAVALLTDMGAPLGRAVGNALEVAESITVLRGEGPAEVRELALALTAEMMVLAGVAEAHEQAAAAAARQLDGGAALERFTLLVKAQGGDAGIIEDPRRLPAARHRIDLTSPRRGHVAAIDARRVGLAALALRAGRTTKDDVIDPAAGVLLRVGVGDPIDEGAPWITLHYGAGADLDSARDRLAHALVVGEEAPARRPLILERRA